MAEILRIFVSATRDLDAERALIGQAVAHLPVKIGIEIRRTPVEGGSRDDMYELIANCDRVYFLLGQDITAPAGAEWYLARELDRSVMPICRAGRPTLAAREFMHMQGVFINWTRFESSADLVKIVTLDLIDILSHPKNRYGLTVTELELLSSHAQRIRTAAAAAKARAQKHGVEESEPSEFDDGGGAEGGGVLLDSGRREPLMGVLIGEDY